jgi:Rieske Fe-S protein
MTRRDLIKGFIGGVTIIALPPVLASCTKPNDNSQSTGDIVIDLKNSSYAALANPGGSVSIRNVIVINSGGEFVALSNICTHQGCQVAYNSSQNRLVCPCHFSAFSITGSVLNGPAASPLRSYTISREGDVLTISA